MRTIWKFNLNTDYDVVVDGGAPRVVHVGVDPTGNPHMPCAWVEIDPDDPAMGTMALRFIGTGHDVPIGWEPVGSTVAGPYVWHVYSKGR